MTDPRPPVPSQPCYLCKRPIVPDASLNETVADSWCYGCEEYICEECCVGTTDGYGHAPEDHAVED